MKTVIVQSVWGRGINFASFIAKRYSSDLFKYCVPSVRQYAARHGYSYVLHRPDRLHFNFPVSDALLKRMQSWDRRQRMKVRAHPTKADGQFFNSFFEPYYAMNELSALYDRFIYLDLDIYIKPNAPAMPHTKGVWVCNESQADYSWLINVAGFKEIPHNRQLNSGVLVLDRKAVRSFYDYLRHAKPDPRSGGDQDSFRLWSLKNKINIMDDKWNLIVAFHKNRDGHFIHYVKKGWIARELAAIYLRPFYWCDSVLAEYNYNLLSLLYSALKSVERSIRRTQIFQFFRRLWKQRART